MPDNTLIKVNNALKVEIERKRQQQLEQERKFLVASIGSDLAKMLIPVFDSLSVQLANSIKDAVANITVNVPSELKIPEIKVPKAEVTVKLPDMPEIKVPTPKVTVNPPKVTVKVPQLKIPESTQRLPESFKLKGINKKSPMPVMFVDAEGKPAYMGGGGGPKVVTARPQQDVPLTYSQLTVSSTAVALPDVPKKADKAVIAVESATIRYREDGTVPTSTVGTKNFQNTFIILEGRERIGGFRAIRTGSTDAKLSINYYERK